MVPAPTPAFRVDLDSATAEPPLRPPVVSPSWRESHSGVHPACGDALRAPSCRGVASESATPAEGRTARIPLDVLPSLSRGETICRLILGLRALLRWRRAIHLAKWIDTASAAVFQHRPTRQNSSARPPAPSNSRSPRPGAGLPLFSVPKVAESRQAIRRHFRGSFRQVDEAEWVTVGISRIRLFQGAERGWLTLRQRSLSETWR